MHKFVVEAQDGQTDRQMDRRTDGQTDRVQCLIIFEVQLPLVWYHITPTE